MTDPTTSSARPGGALRSAVAAIMPHILITSIALNVALAVVAYKIKTAVDVLPAAQHISRLGGVEQPVIQPSAELESCTVTLTKYKRPEPGGKVYWGAMLDACRPDPRE